MNQTGSIDDISPQCLQRQKEIVWPLAAREKKDVLTVHWIVSNHDVCCYLFDID